MISGPVLINVYVSYDENYLFLCLNIWQLYYLLL